MYIISTWQNYNFYEFLITVATQPHFQMQAARIRHTSVMMDVGKHVEDCAGLNVVIAAVFQVLSL